MKKLLFLFTLLTLMVMGTSYAQLSKEEAKEWKKAKKAMSPEEFKTMVDQNTELQQEVNQMSAELSASKSDLQQKQEEVAVLQGKVQNLEQDLAETQVIDVSSGEASTKGTKVAKGVLFKVQIGAFRNKDLSKYFDASNNFGGEVDTDGTQRYTLGNFTDYWEADKFKKYLREMGVKDAWIVPYKDGRRVPMKDVLEGVI
jgi:seryl-tRNA synthetase